jgi:hypothetical protein
MMGRCIRGQYVDSKEISSIRLRAGSRVHSVVIEVFTQAPLVGCFRAVQNFDVGIFLYYYLHYLQAMRRAVSIASLTFYC